MWEKPASLVRFKAHTPARGGAAGVISLFGGFGGPHPRFGSFDLSREINENKDQLVPKHPSQWLIQAERHGQG
jgi:hypothetical protein